MEAYAFAGIREQKRRESAAMPLRRRGANRGAGFTLTAASAAPAKGKKGAVPAAPVKPDLGAVLKKASASAFRGGVAGFAAGVVQARPPPRPWPPHGDPLALLSLRPLTRAPPAPRARAGGQLHVDAHGDELPGAPRPRTRAAAHSPETRAPVAPPTPLRSAR